MHCGTTTKQVLTLCDVATKVLVKCHIENLVSLVLIHLYPNRQTLVPIYEIWCIWNVATFNWFNFMTQHHNHDWNQLLEIAAEMTLCLLSKVPIHNNWIIQLEFVKCTLYVYLSQQSFSTVYMWGTVPSMRCREVCNTTLSHMATLYCMLLLILQLLKMHQISTGVPIVVN